MASRSTPAGGPAPEKTPVLRLVKPDPLSTRVAIPKGPAILDNRQQGVVYLVLLKTLKTPT